MSAGLVPSPAAALAVIALAAAAAGGCTRVVDAVIPEDCGLEPNMAGCTPTAWPIAGHGANSDPWLVSHRAVITQMRPRVLVLNFQNGRTVDDARANAERQVAAVAEGSRYHGYVDPAAPAFVIYEIVKVVDLTDATPPPGWPYPSSTLLPTAPTGEFDVLALFSSQFAERYGFPDPRTPTRALSLCELYEQGIINEVWIQDGEPDLRRVPLSLERKQAYDGSERAIPGSFVPGAGGSGRPLADIICGVSVRLAHLDAARGPGCDLQVRGWEIEAMWEALPSLAADARAFLNRDFDTRFGVLLKGWAEICDEAGTPCVEYPTPQSARGSYANGMPWSISPFLQGCGSTRFPPNARSRGDMVNPTPVESRCAHFGLGDGPGGGDAYEPYVAAQVAALEQAFPDCGGGWQIYWRQSIPGYGTRARGSDGAPMKNWWPLLFY